MSKTAGSEIALLIREINLKINENMRSVFKNMGLTMPQLMVLRILTQKDGMKISELSNKMNLANSTVSGIIDRLEKLEFVNRIRSEEDKRVVYVELSKKSKNLYDDFNNLSNEYLEKNLKDTQEEQITNILTGLKILRDLLRNTKDNG